MRLSAVAFTRLARGKYRDTVKVFAASLADINRALAVPKKDAPKPNLPPELQQYTAVFERKLAEVLPPLRGPGIDHKINRSQTRTDAKPDLLPLVPIRDE